MPLADTIRPESLDQIVGQAHLLHPSKPLRNIIDRGIAANMIFYGPSGTGKTTVANIIAKSCGKSIHKLNGTSASISDIKDIISQRGTFTSANGILLYLDEIQYLNKKQQQCLLEYIENGDITLIAATTENPYFYVYNAILSRCTVFQFKHVSPNEIIPAIQRGFSLAQEIYHMRITYSDEVVNHIAYSCGGDVRKALNFVELCVLAANDGIVTMDTVESLTQKSSMVYDRNGDSHFDILSAFQKSIRGSDENAALHYLARLIVAGDLPSICRRLLVIASEDIGLAHPTAISVVKSCVDSALQLGFPEARIPLAQAVILLCTSPKSNSALTAIDEAMADVEKGGFGDIPSHLKDGHYSGAEKLGNAKGYLYPHAFPNHYIQQQYLPNPLKDRIYYRFGNNKMEQSAKQYRENIKKQFE